MYNSDVLASSLLSFNMHDISGTVMHTISYSDGNEFEGQIENEYRLELFLNDLLPYGQSNLTFTLQIRNKICPSFVPLVYTAFKGSQNIFLARTLKYVTPHFPLNVVRCYSFHSYM